MLKRARFDGARLAGLSHRALGNEPDPIGPTPINLKSNPMIHEVEVLAMNFEVRRLTDRDSFDLDRWGVGRKKLAGIH
jgi:hypothetical protein